MAKRKMGRAAAGRQKPLPAEKPDSEKAPQLGSHVDVAGCCEILERDETRLVRASDGVWRLLRWGANPQKKGTTLIFDTYPVHACPKCGAPLDGEGLAALIERVPALEEKSADELNALLAPVVRYRWGHDHINTRLRDLGCTPPDPRTPIKIKPIKTGGA